MRKVSVILRAAERVLEEEGWVKEAYAVDSDGYRADATEPHAAAFCALGSIQRAARGPAESDEATDFLQSVALLHLDAGVAGYNDRNSTTKENVLWLFDKAIEMAKDCE